MCPEDDQPAGDAGGLSELMVGSLDAHMRHKQNLTRITAARGPHVLAWGMLPRWDHVAFDQVPVFRAQALALIDARRHGEAFTLYSGDRRAAVIDRFNRRHHTHLHSQVYLYRLWLTYLRKYGAAGAIARGVYPANPPDRGSHLLLGDGTVGRVGQKLARYELGLDIVSHGQINSCGPLVSWLNSHGYHALQPYASGSELHHMVFEKDPTWNARKRLGLLR